MNSLKTVIVLIMFLGVGYAVYSAINNGAGTPAQSGGEWPAAPGASKEASAQAGLGPGSPSSMNVQVAIPGEAPPPGTSRISRRRTRRAGPGMIPTGIHRATRLE